MMLRKLDFSSAESEMSFVTFTLYKINLKQITNLNFKPQALKLLEENTRHWHGRSMFHWNTSRTRASQHQQVDYMKRTPLYGKGNNGPH